MSILQFILGLATTVGIKLAWVHATSQTKVVRTAANSARIAIRLIAVQSLFAYLMCSVCGAPMWLCLLSMFLVFAATSAVTLNSVPSGQDAFQFAVGMTVLLPLYALQQFVLGFPDRDLVILTPPITPVTDNPTARRADTGIALSTLRPMGLIEVFGERFSAVSESGTLIHAGTPVRIVGNRGTLHLVEAIAGSDVEAG